MLGYYETEEVAHGHTKKVFEGAQPDVEPTTSVDYVVKIIQVILTFL